MITAQISRAPSPLLRTMDKVILTRAHEPAGDKSDSSP